MSIVCPSFLTFPWQPLFSCRFGQKIDFFDIILYFFQFSPSNCRNSPIYTFDKHCGLILSHSLLFVDFLRKIKIQDGRSNNSKAQGYLINVNLLHRALTE